MGPWVAQGKIKYDVHVVKGMENALDALNLLFTGGNTGKLLVQASDEQLMRITGGTLRGRKLVAPEDIRVRPTSDRARQAIFNILSHNDFGIGFALDGARVADMFAGTGALGIEAISHGAAFCLFVDDSAESRALIRENVEALALTGVTKIWRRDATRSGADGGRFGRAVRPGVSRSALSQGICLRPRSRRCARDGWPTMR